MVLRHRRLHEACSPDSRRMLPMQQAHMCSTPRARFPQMPDMGGKHLVTRTILHRLDLN